MELFCPQCLLPLQPADGERAVCPKHGDHFKVLYSRQPFVQEPVMTNDGTATAPVGDGYGPARSPDTPPPAPPITRLSIPCAQHAEVMAVAQCSQCGAAVCETCDFAFPGNVHLCPNCATNPRVELSPKRKSMAIWSIVLGGLSTAILVCAIFIHIIIPDDPETAQIFASVLVFGTLAMSLIGLGLGISSRSRHAANPAITYVGWVWCSIMLGIYGLLMVAGIMAGA